MCLVEGRERAPQVSGRRPFQAKGAAGAKALGWGWAWPAQEPGRPVWPGQLGERRAEGLGGVSGQAVWPVRGYWIQPLVREVSVAVESCLKRISLLLLGVRGGWEAEERRREI